jgi:hypothetical protein
MNTCPNCDRDIPFDVTGVSCVCHQYGYAGHEELLWCSIRCVDAHHPFGSIAEEPTEWTGVEA